MRNSKDEKKTTIPRKLFSYRTNRNTNLTVENEKKKTEGGEKVRKS